MLARSGPFLDATEYYGSSHGLLSEAIEQFEQALKIKTDDPYAPSFQDGHPVLKERSTYGFNPRRK